MARVNTLQEYQMSLLHGLWLYKYGKARPKSLRLGTELQQYTGGRLLSDSRRNSNASVGGNSTIEQDHESAEDADADPANLSSKLSLLLMMPLLKSHAAAVSAPDSLHSAQASNFAEDNTNN